MKKTYGIHNIDCAFCAAKIEAAVVRLPGVKHASLSFFAEKLTVEAEEADFPEIEKQILKAVKKLEPDCTVDL
ncbi:MAG: cation transporter [Firmicutes bacterium]|nr:cation transporter [Bacillota bacterium]